MQGEFPSAGMPLSGMLLPNSWQHLLPLAVSTQPCRGMAPSHLCPLILESHPSPFPSPAEMLCGSEPGQVPVRILQSGSLQLGGMHYKVGHTFLPSEAALAPKRQAMGVLALLAAIVCASGPRVGVFTHSAPLVPSQVWKCSFGPPAPEQNHYHEEAVQVSVSCCALVGEAVD